ncbi:MAG: hypothetical protein KGM96_15830 [Acidobacteriota bacterium]|nr:hypothetical protein [Acidobacteriota bacterium]
MVRALFRPTAIRENVERTHAWRVMSNHFHLCLETPLANMVEGMRWLQGTYASGSLGCAARAVQQKT